MSASTGGERPALGPHPAAVEGRERVIRLDRRDGGPHPMAAPGRPDPATPYGCRMRSPGFEGDLPSRQGGAGR
jgi:hypothetical protein